MIACVCELLSLSSYFWKTMLVITSCFHHDHHHHHTSPVSYFNNHIHSLYQTCYHCSPCHLNQYSHDQYWYQQCQCYSFYSESSSCPSHSHPHVLTCFIPIEHVHRNWSLLVQELIPLVVGVKTIIPQIFVIERSLFIFKCSLSQHCI